MDNQIMSHNPRLLGKGLHMFVMDSLSKNPEKQLTYYFPIGHSKNQVL